MTTKTFIEIADEMKNYIISHQSKLTDFNEGSVILSFIEAVARCAASLETRAQLGFFDVIKSMPYSAFNFEQKAGKKASGRVTFSRDKTYSYQTTIPVGTEVMSGSLSFTTTVEGVISAGETESLPLDASAAEVGTDYNVPALSITTIASALPSDVKTVTNISAFTGGEDAESFTAYMTRFAEYIKGLGGTSGYGVKSRVEALDFVRSCAFEPHFPPLDIIGTDDAGLYNATIYAEDGSGSLTDEELEAVKLAVDGDGTTDNEGCKACGLKYRYQTPTAVNADLQITVYVTNDALNERSESIVQTDVSDTTESYVNSLVIGADLIMSDLVVELKKQLTYLLDVEISNSNIMTQSNEIVRYYNCTVTVEIPY